MTTPLATAPGGVIGARENALSVSVARTLTVSLGGTRAREPGHWADGGSQARGRTETAPSLTGAVDVRPSTWPAGVRRTPHLGRLRADDVVAAAGRDDQPLARASDGDLVAGEVDQPPAGAAVVDLGAD